ncbi:MAG: TIGR02300 family protein [Kordiimonadaceae bacterium]|nr:TIGR02300 family protein [Kordiimonadaceae bacterium]MBO6568177.1 TIGR02300 family protein [Kordiimonadaceae bacterium]MBO6964093.1 TIGR02300 family protein [Kordiimonadaceae bacterium]
MAKQEWGTKRTCPKCGERFYDLGKDDPVTCIACGEEWVPEPILKTKQPIVVEKKEEKAEEETSNDDDIDLDDEDLDNVSLDDDDDEEVSSMVDTSLSEDDS